MSRTLLAALLLAAGCYVTPQQPPPPPPTAQPQCVDMDGDGYCADIDCNDNNPSVYPGAPDNPGDGLDQNCDGYY